MRRTAAFLTSVVLLAGHAAKAAEPAPFDSGFGEHRLEQRPPAGRVPPAPALPAIEPGGGEEQPYIGQRPALSEPSPRIADLKSFAEAYRRAGSPRLAIYFNRELSEQISEWLPQSLRQLELTQDSALIAETNRGTAVQAGATNRITLSETHALHSGPTVSREGLEERWRWQFEDAVSQTFLAADARVIDRALMLRQMAANRTPGGTTSAAVSMTTNEMVALNGFADVLIEILVARSTDGTADLRATAKRLSDGQLLGSALLRAGELGQSEQPGRFVPTAGGYMRERQRAEPSVAQQSEALALRLMRSMEGRL